MEVTYNWKIQKMNTKPSEDGLTNVVASVEWSCSAKTTFDGADVYSNAIDFCSFGSPGNDFTPYDELTQDEVLSWVWNIVSKDKIEGDLLIDLQRIISPPVIVLPNPWE